MKRTTYILTCIFTVVSLFGSFASIQAATVKSAKKVNYYKTASTKKKAGTFKKATKLTAKSMAKGFVKFTKGKKTYYIKASDVKISGKFTAKVAKKAKAYNTKFKATKTTLNKGKSLTITKVAVKKKIAYLKYSSKNYVKATDVKVTSFTSSNILTPKPTDTPLSSIILNSDPDKNNIFKNYSFTEKVIVKNDKGMLTEVDYAVPTVHGDFEFSDKEITEYFTESGEFKETSPWNFKYSTQSSDYADTSIVVTEEAKRNGKYGLKFGVYYTTGHMKFVGLKQNTDYIFDFWMKNKSDTGVFNVKTKRAGIDITEYAFGHFLSIEDTCTEWTQYRLEFNTEKALGGEVLLVFENLSKSHIYLDDMRLYTKYDPSCLPIIGSTPLPDITATPAPTPPPPVITAMPTATPAPTTSPLSGEAVTAFDAMENTVYKTRLSKTVTNFTQDELWLYENKTDEYVIVDNRDYYQSKFKTSEFPNVFVPGKSYKVYVLVKGVQGSNMDLIVYSCDPDSRDEADTETFKTDSTIATGEWQLIEFTGTIPEKATITSVIFMGSQDESNPLPAYHFAGIAIQEDTAQ